MFLLASLKDIQEILTSEDQGSIRLLESVAGQFFPEFVAPFNSRGLLLTGSSQSDLLKEAKEPFRTCLPASCSVFKVFLKNFGIKASGQRV